MNAPDRKLAEFRVNPHWAKLPLFASTRLMGTSGSTTRSILEPGLALRNYQ